MSIICLNMLHHFLALAYRNILRFKAHFLMNLTGLSVGLACVMLIYLWIDDELKVDKFHEKRAQLYQVIKNNTEPHGIDTSEDTPPLLAQSLAEEIPEIETTVAVFPPADYAFKGILSFNQTHIKAESKFAQRDFFSIFSFPLIHGTPERVLGDPYGVVISKAVAMKLFNTTEDVVGKSLNWEGEWHQGDFVVTGIFENLPSGTTLHFDVIFPFDYLQVKSPQFFNWQNNNSNTFIVLTEGTNLDAFNQKIAGFVKSKSEGSTITLFARKFTDRYLFGRYENGRQSGGRIDYVRMFSLIAVFILLIACINFINLTTARASTRLKEVGVKKTFGAGRKILVLQYLGESMIITSCATLLAVLLVDISLPYFNEITGKEIQLNFDHRIVLVTVALTTITALIAGVYPALFLSGFNPARILKGRGLQPQNTRSSHTKWARNALVLFQFTISVILIVCVIVVHRQMTFVQSQDLGFKRDNIITFTSEGRLADSTETFLRGMKQIPGVINASVLDGDLVSLHSGTTAVDWDGKSPAQVIDFELMRAGYDLIETLGIKMKEGRDFSREFNTESSAVIFNEAAIESMGLTDPIGKTVKIWGQDKVIIGVVENFHFESLYENLKPFFFLITERRNNNFLVKIKGGTTRQTLADLTTYYQQFNLGLPFEYRFLDDDLQANYAAENRVSLLSRYFAGLAIFLSCLGLFGLAAFTAERRSKEIGIRKVLGSSEMALVILLSKDFTILVVLAIVVALPLSYIITDNWLAGFAYRITPQWFYFLGAGLAALTISWMTIGAQAIRAARTNPAKTLRSE